MASASTRKSGRVTRRADAATTTSNARLPVESIGCCVERASEWIIEMAASNVAAWSRFGFAGAGRTIAVGSRRYLPGILLELALLLIILAGFQLSGYGRQPGRLNNIPLGLAFAALAWGAAEARFRLYRRIWAVAGFPDARAIALAVVEASVLI